ncbi:unnamed protein product [Symbiodinium sp. CCMP2456]|nr:unnamed protein product [Symbiodinium sp. CCMP2456]
MAEEMDLEQATEARQQLQEVLGTAAPSSFGGEEEKEPENKPKYQKPQHQGGGKGWKANSANPSRSWWSDSPAAKTDGKLPDVATQHILKTLVKMVTRHEEELARIRIDTNFMLFVDVIPHGVYELPKLTAEKWHEKFTAKKVTMSLRVILLLALLGEIQQRMEQTVDSEEQLERCMSIGWMGEGATKLNSEHCETPPLTHTAALTHVQTLQDMIAIATVLTRFRCPMSKDPGQKQPLMKDLEQAYLGVPYTDWAQHETSWNRSCASDEKPEEDK